MKKILFAAAGTGGHLFPAIAIAKQIEKKCEVHFLSTGRDLESKIPSNYKIHHIEKVALRGLGIIGLIKFLFKFPKMFLEIRKLFLDHKIDYVLGLGGYTSGPALLVAKFLKIKTSFVEPNSHVGVSNRLSAPFVDDIFITFLSKGIFKNYQKKLHDFGLPQIESDESDIAYQNWDVIIMGGSQGARGINKKIFTLIEKRYFDKLKVLWQTGPLWEKEMGRIEQKNIVQVAFVKNIKSHLKNSKVAISRTGAGACHDIVNTEVPSILVPLPNEKDPHYLNNALALVNNNAALLFHEYQGVDILETLLDNLLKNSEKGQDVKLQLKKFQYPVEPAKKIAEFIMEQTNV